MTAALVPHSPCTLHINSVVSRMCLEVLWWDIRKLQQPVELFCLDIQKKQDCSHTTGVTCLEYEPTMVTTTHALKQPILSIVFTHFNFVSKESHLMFCNMGKCALMTRTFCLQYRLATLYLSLIVNALLVYRSDKFNTKTQQIIVMFQFFCGRVNITYSFNNTN